MSVGSEPQRPAESSLKSQLLALLQETTATRAGDDPYWAIAAGQKMRPPQAEVPPATTAETARPVAAKPAAERPIVSAKPSFVDASISPTTQNSFLPLEPATLNEAGLSEREVESLILKFLLQCGNVSGRTIAEQIRLPFKLLQRILAQMKLERLVVYRGDAGMNDYQYELTDIGCDRARRYAQHCTYFGAAPVPLADYLKAIHAQTLSTQKPTRTDLQRAFHDLMLSQEMFSQLGQALHAGRGLFLFGAPGNGKTSIAQRVTRAFGEHLWIPRCLSMFGEIVRLFDPSNHEELPLPDPPTIVKDQKIDERWIRIRRPTIVVGGELTMDSLEVRKNPQTGISEGPLQLKANGGTLVIDDFGRQRIGVDELLNRWIVPLETGYDYLNVANGRKVQVPFDQLIVFSTNLEPRDLVDEAFLRRIPYKIEVADPCEAEFRNLFEKTASQMNMQCSPEMVEYLVDKHFKYAGRAMRFCLARDLLRQVTHWCTFHEEPLTVTKQNLDAAVKNYFAALTPR